MVPSYHFKMDEESDINNLLQLNLGIDDSNLVKMNEIKEECVYQTTLDKYEFIKTFSVLHMNVRSMKNKREDIQNFLKIVDIEFDAICISETWLKDGIVKYYDMENYNLFASCRPIGEGGGTAIYVHNKHEAEQRKDLESVELETNFVQIKLKTKSGVSNILVGEIYRPPGYSNKDFLSYIEDVLDSIENERKTAIVAGDFNYNLLPTNQEKCNNDFINLMTSYGYFPMISKATRIQKQSETLLDNIFINNISAYKSSGIIVEDLSDHLPIFLSLKLENSSPMSKTQKTVTVFDARKMQDLNELLVEKLSNFQTNTDANVASDQLVKAYSDGIALCSKTYKPSRRKSAMKPWITASILCSINKRTQLYHKFIRRGNKTNEENYKTYRNVLVKTIREAKRLYFQDQLRRHKKDGKATWALLNQVINKKSKNTNKYPDTCYDSRGESYQMPDIADGFNTFFSSVGQLLDEAIPRDHADPLTYMKRIENEPGLTVPKLTVNDVENLIKSLNSVGGGIDKITTQILLGTYKNIIHHLVFFFNLCLETAVFPANLKIAIITPIHKVGPKDSFNNYRPISILPIFSKILEKVLHRTLSSYLEENNMLYPFQFGFRKNIAHICQ